MEQDHGREIIFKIRNLKTWFPIRKGVMKKVAANVKAVDDVSLDVYRGETLGIVGESGCGKSTLGKSVMLLEKPTDGQVLYNFDGEFKDITEFTRKETLAFRREVQMVFQDPYSALNPLKKIYDAFEEPLKVHGIKTKGEREAVMEEVLQMVNIQPDYLLRYPHEFSGGQRQRLCIARALEVKPQVLVCDEPVSALDVSIQAQVLNLMKAIQKEMSLTYLFIAHDLSVVKYMSDRIVVMYLGKIVEVADSRTLYREPLHPYTKALLSAIPVPDIHREKKRQVLTGEVPSPIHKPEGCAFHPRCPHCMDICRKEDPALAFRKDPAFDGRGDLPGDDDEREASDKALEAAGFGRNGHLAACHLYHKR